MLNIFHYISFFITLLLLSQQSYSQPDLKAIDKMLSDTYTKLQKADSETRYDSIAPLFKQQIIKHLSSPLTFNNNLDSLETLITVVQSPDKKLKFYSWDELTGGTWHEINVFVQYKGLTNKILYEQIDTDKEAEEGGFTDSYIYSVNEIKEKGNVFYVTFGWGTHGSGDQHTIIQVFRILNGKLIKCVAFNKKQKELIIEYHRREVIDIKFNIQDNSISYNEFIPSEENRFENISGKRKTLKFSNGVFR